MEDIGKTLRMLRTEAGLTQKEVARRLSQTLKPITHQAVSKWETGDAQPGVLQFLALCRLYGVEDVFGAFWPRAEETLNAEGRRKLREYEQLLRLSGLYAPAPARPPQTARTLRLYALPASAGTGQFLDGDDCELVEAGADVPDSADFGVRLAGDSMAPRFADGQVVWVKEQPTLQTGEIGLFYYDGCAWCKKLEIGAEGARLLSLNPKYAPIPVAQPDDLRIFGKVVE